MKRRDVIAGLLFAATFGARRRSRRARYTTSPSLISACRLLT
jgi:hypothetical protein